MSDLIDDALASHMTLKLLTSLIKRHEVTISYDEGTSTYTLTCDGNKYSGDSIGYLVESAGDAS